jgi:hypothetical protein
MLTGDREAKLRAIAGRLRAEMEVGRGLLAIENPTPEQLQDIFNFKRTIIQGLVREIEVSPDKPVTVHLELGDDPADGEAVLLISDTTSRRPEWETETQSPRRG